MAQIIFELGINFVETSIVFDFITRYLGCKYQDKRKIIGFVAAWLISFIQLSVLNSLVIFEGIGMFIPLIIDFIYAFFFLKGNVFLKLWISAVVEILAMIIAIGTNLFVCNIIGYDPIDMITVFNSTRIISVIITKIIFFYTTRIILKYKYKNPLENKSWIMLILMPVTSVISLTALMLAAMNSVEIKNYILIGMTGVVFANVITYYFFNMLNKDYETRLKVSLLEQQNENFIKNMENTDAFVKQMKSVKHDIKNQLLVLYGYIDEKNNEEAKRYIKKLTNEHLPDIQNYINTENSAFNAIINSKIAVCNQKGIYIEIKEKKASLSYVDAVDIGILFGNLLDNAIEAAEQTQAKKIGVDVEKKGEYLSILVTNSINKSVLGENKNLETSKDNKELHGVGIKSIKNVVKKYDGLIDFFEEENEFCCHIMLQA